MSQQLKNECIDFLNAARARQHSYSFRLVLAQLRAVGAPTATGWGALLQKFADLNAADDKIDWQAFRGVCNQVRHNSILVGHAATFIYDIVGEVAQDVDEKIGRIVNEESVFHAGFPKPLTRAALERAPFAPAVVSHVRNPAGDHLLVACSKRAYRERKALDVDEMAANVREALSEYDEVIGVKRGVVQAYDRIVIRPRARRVEIHIDMCCPLSAEELQQYAQVFKAKILDLELADKEIFGPKNLFGRIAVLYAQKDGNIISLGHATGTRSVKEERMRVKTLDLRAELFHDEGIKAIVTTDSYSVKKGWAQPGRVPNLHIPGHFSMAGSPDAVVDHALLDGCMNQADFDMLMTHLV